MTVLSQPQSNKLLARYLQDEMVAREWDDAYIDAKITDKVDRLSVYFAIYCEEEGLILDEHTAKLLSRIFDVSSETFIDLNNAGRPPMNDQIQ